jgi:hypothetical protein
MPPPTVLNEQLRRALDAQRIEVLYPRERMIQLNGVSAGQGFSKPFTNVLLRQRAGGAWEVFVDEDLHYLGDDPARRGLFGGGHHARWSRLQLAAPLEGDADQAVLGGLRLLDSPILQRLSDLPSARPAAVPDDPWSALPPPPPESAPVELTPRQREWAERIAQVVSRPPPSGALLMGRSGVGKSTLARAAVQALTARGWASGITAVSGAQVSCGAVFLAQRDDSLRQTLQATRRAPRQVLLLEQFELACGNSPVAASLLTDALDGGLRLIAIATPGFTLGLKRFPTLLRRLQPLWISGLEPAEVLPLLERRLAAAPEARRLAIREEVLPVILRLTDRQSTANPGAALALLDAVLAHAAWSGATCLGPDEVYHVAQTPTSQA